MTGQMIREIRQKKGFSQKQFAHLLGVSQPFISAIESGTKPSLSLVKKIEDITGEDCSHIVAEIKAHKEFLKKVKRLDYEKRKAVENLIDRIDNVVKAKEKSEVQQ
jgi:transcriptional regulator with XRE-family HTH domain